jgi:HD-GYP domain-containing protein (c-di-GMP phosphodiesterase class II)
VARTVEVLVRAVELVDPYLLGHSFRVRDLADRLARELGLGTEAAATLRVAASLSQIGKLFVPRGLLTKPGRHTPEEERLMRRHVDHALRVLEGVDLDLPVVAAIAQMHERLDGGGYPLGLEGAAIGGEGRILAVADVFCARTRPRSYRDAIAPADALHHLRSNPGRYDAGVVRALSVILEAEPAHGLSAAAAGGEGAGPVGPDQWAGVISTPQLGPLPMA